MYIWIGTGVLVVLLAVQAVLATRHNRRTREMRAMVFSARDRLDRGEWHRRYFEGADTALLIWLFEPLAAGIGCDVTQLRPDDAFGGTLRIGERAVLGIDGDDPVEDYVDAHVVGVVLERAHDEKQLYGMWPDRTLGELVRVVAAFRTELHAKSPA